MKSQRKSLKKSHKKSLKKTSKKTQKKIKISPDQLREWLFEEFPKTFSSAYRENEYPGWQDLTIYFHPKDHKIVAWGIEEDDPADIYYLYKGKYQKQIKHQKILVSEKKYEGISAYIRKKYPGYKLIENGVSEEVIDKLISV